MYFLLLLWTFTCLSLSSFLPVLASAFTEFNLAYPAVFLNYRVYVEAGKLDCVYQLTGEGAVFAVEFNLIHGGDGFGRFSVKDPQGVTVLEPQYSTNANYTVEKAIPGYYAICIENDSKYSAKLVGILLATYRVEGIQQYIEDIQQVYNDSVPFTRTFDAVSETINRCQQYIFYSKSREARDYALLKENNYNVGFWSLVQFLIILGSGIFQVFIIRQFFREKPSYGKYKVRL